ncbi:MAG: NRDE family protein [Candidatus Hydrogenedentes bacterium]|nr:NRDE family protein [Candidatus Hydrogenedentota bacterium]
MCTVTVHRSTDRLLVTMNRDEARDRAPELPPAIYQSDVSWLAPSDSARGGTWIGVNNRGVVACLLNGYVEGDSFLREKNTEGKSRGAIIPWLMALGSAHVIRDAAMTNFDPHRFMSFSLLVADQQTLDAYHWRGGDELAHESHRDEWSFFSSSSWKTEEVIAWRRRAFDDWREGDCATIGALPTLHVLHPDGKHEWSPLMDRERTCTRSITQIEIQPMRGDAVMRYWRRDALDAGEEPVIAALPLHQTEGSVNLG